MYTLKSNDRCNYFGYNVPFNVFEPIHSDLSQY